MKRIVERSESMILIRLPLFRVAFYKNGGIAMTFRYWLKPTDFNVYVIRQGQKS